jgi:carboxylesterase type B
MSAGCRRNTKRPPYYGTELARKGIVVVTLNFRLGVLAGMGHPQERAS